jgi:hypothetical protein
VEWTWLEAFHAADAETLGLAELAGMNPHLLAVRKMSLHPAARLVPLEAASDFEWDGLTAGRGDHCLLTRPGQGVEVRMVDNLAAETFLLAKDHPLSPDSLAQHGPQAIALIEAGAIILEPQP